MIQILLWLLAGFAYFAVGCWTFGYTGVKSDMRNPWGSPGPFLTGLLWPLGLPTLLVGPMLSNMGMSFATKQIERKIRREKQLQKVRIELEDAEREMGEVLGSHRITRSNEKFYNDE